MSHFPSILTSFSNIPSQRLKIQIDETNPILPKLHKSCILAAFPNDYSAAMAQSSRNPYSNLPPRGSLDHKLYILAYLVTMSMKYFRCGDRSISRVLTNWGLGHLGSAVALRLEGHELVEQLCEGDQEHRQSICSSAGHTYWYSYPWFDLDGAEISTKVNYVGHVPMSIELSCSELRDFTRRRELPVRATDGRQILMTIDALDESGRLGCDVLEWRETIEEPRPRDDADDLFLNNLTVEDSGSS